MTLAMTLVRCLQRALYRRFLLAVLWGCGWVMGESNWVVLQAHRLGAHVARLLRELDDA